MTKKVKIALVRKDLGIVELARQLGTSNGYVSLVLGGKKPGHNIRPRLAAILGLSEQSLAREIDKAKKERASHA